MSSSGTVLSPDKNDVVVEAVYKYQQMLSRRDGWRNIFSMLCKYIRLRPAWFGDVGIPWVTPRMSVANVSDDTVIDSARTCAASLGGALWPNNDESFELAPKEDFSDSTNDADFTYRTDENAKYLQWATQRLRNAIGSFEGRFLVAQAEHLDEQVVMGTSGIFGEEDEDNDYQPFHFQSCGVETCVIDENSKGHIDTVYFEYAYTARQVVDKYGYKNVSAETKGLYDSKKYTTYIKVIQAVEPRPNGKVGAEKWNKPYKSIHFEYAAQHLLKEDGMDECPVFMARFRKLPMELYGRSLAMDALPTVKELNVLRHAFSRALLLILDPPLGFYHDQIGGGGEINISPHARVPLYATGRIPQGQMPIVPLLQLAEPAVAERRIENLTELVDGKFLNDVLTDFNNKTRMTLGEADKREGLREQALSGIFARQIVEVYHPMIMWSFNVMMRRGLLGLHPVRDNVQIQLMRLQGLSPMVIPMAFARAMDAGKTPFTVRFISPAARAMRADTRRGLEQLTNYVLAVTNAGGIGAADNVDTDDAVRQAAGLYGAPASVIVGMDKVKKIRDQRQATQQQQMQLEMAKAKSEINKNQGKAVMDYSKAGVPPQTQMQPQLQQAG